MQLIKLDGMELAPLAEARIKQTHLGSLRYSCLDLPFKENPRPPLNLSRRSGIFEIQSSMPIR